jgi:hypothetical protein
MRWPRRWRRPTCSACSPIADRREQPERRLRPENERSRRRAWPGFLILPGQFDSDHRGRRAGVVRREPERVAAGAVRGLAATKRGLASPPAHSAWATTRRSRLQRSRVDPRKSLQRRHPSPATGTYGCVTTLSCNLFCRTGQPCFRSSDPCGQDTVSARRLPQSSQQSGAVFLATDGSTITPLRHAARPSRARPPRPAASRSPASTGASVRRPAHRVRSVRADSA